MDRIMEQLRAYCPWNEQEEADCAELLRRLGQGEDLWTRENRSAHLTASGWIVSPERDRVLMAYHNLYDSWSWLGGHADGDHDLLAVALREAQEESGLSTVRAVSPELFSVEILTVDGHEKRGHYVPSHLHLNVTYLLEADPALPIRCKPDENSRVGRHGLIGAVVPRAHLFQAQCQALRGLAQINTENNAAEAKRPLPVFLCFCALQPAERHGDPRSGAV